MSTDITTIAPSMADKASEAAKLLRALAHDGRLLVLCALVEVQEASAGHLVELVGLSQSALSQHLAILREQDLVATRRDGTSIFTGWPMNGSQQCLKHCTGFIATLPHHHRRHQ